MKKSLVKLIEKAAQATVLLQTLEAIKTDATLRARLVGPELTRHLDANNAKAIKALKREYDKTPAGQRNRLKIRWISYVDQATARISKIKSELQPNDTELEPSAVTH